MLLAFDDTDSATGGCTTHALLAVLDALDGVAPRGLPRLVRLNPNVPWKTRGNGAVCVELARIDGPSVRVGEWRGMEIHAHPHGPPATRTYVDLDRLWEVIQATAQPDASPAVALFDSPPPEAWYWAAVRQTLDPQDAVAAVESEPSIDARWAGDGRALIGCLGGAAWRGPASSHEFIAYRDPAQWGTPRNVDDAPLRGLDAAGATFHTEDPDSGRLACVPHTPCPVLLGLRGHDADRLVDRAMWATRSAAGEPIDAWILWDSNQASGDHVTAVPTLLEAEDGMTIRVDAIVADAPRTAAGGHVHVEMDDGMGVPFTAIAFEPTGGFRDAVRALLPGDAVSVTGAWGDRSVRLESVELRTPVARKVANPTHCDRPMKSKGMDAGYRCACGATAPENAAQFEPRSPGSWDVPVMARRHLHRPFDAQQ